MKVKMKTKRSAAKRYKLTGTGKLMRRKAFKNHILTKKSEKRKRNLSLNAQVDKSDLDRALLQVPYLQYLR
ncbi:MAG: 50S ribosomal protein L35 [Candidatus Melainabacteria bacterium HGW-Melainabacteria-1]|nr:MAG: 50S ribosomal protein L35 [Candidatus Melainabacteria bacterium HGW-Melainabacteria-1]